jgi:uncharacterized Zn finger protein (UPF0148 family)
MTWYDCPKCGLKESSWDGHTFCGVCEEEYWASLSNEERENIRNEQRY